MLLHMLRVIALLSAAHQVQGIKVTASASNLGAPASDAEAAASLKGRFLRSSASAQDLLAAKEPAQLDDISHGQESLVALSGDSPSSDAEAAASLEDPFLHSSASAQDLVAAKELAQSTTSRRLSDHCETTSHSSRHSVISFANWKKAAGLNDRSFFLERIATYAALLGARVRYPPPCQILTQKHNNHKRIDCAVQWSDYKIFTFADDGSSVFADDTQNIQFSRIRGKTVREQYCNARQKAADNSFFLWEIDIAKKSPYRTLHSLVNTMKNEDACGDINGEDNATKRLFREVNKKPSLCKFVNINAAASVYEICNRTMTSLRITQGSYISLHIRREKHCDTSIKRIVDYLACFASSSEQLLLNWMSTLLIFTDVKDPHYMNVLLESIRKIRPVNSTSQILPIHVDPIIRRIMHQAQPDLRIPSDNYYNFDVGQEIQKKGLLRIEFRRSSRCGITFHHQTRISTLSHCAGRG